MTDTKLDEIDLGAQVTTPHGVGVVTWVEVGGDEFRVLMYNRESSDLFAPQKTVTVDRAHIAYWPARKPEERDRKVLLDLADELVDEAIRVNNEAISKPQPEWSAALGQAERLQIAAEIIRARLSIRSESPEKGI